MGLCMCVSGWVHGFVCEWVHGFVCGCMGLCVCEWVLGFVCEWVGAWVGCFACTIWKTVIQSTFVLNYMFPICHSSHVYASIVFDHSLSTVCVSVPAMASGTRNVVRRATGPALASSSSSWAA